MQITHLFTTHSLFAKPPFLPDLLFEWCQIFKNLNTNLHSKYLWDSNDRTTFDYVKSQYIAFTNRAQNEECYIKRYGCNYTELFGNRNSWCKNDKTPFMSRTHSKQLENNLNKIGSDLLNQTLHHRLFIY